MSGSSETLPLLSRVATRSKMSSRNAFLGIMCVMTVTMCAVEKTKFRSEREDLKGVSLVGVGRCRYVGRKASRKWLLLDRGICRSEENWKPPMVMVLEHGCRFEKLGQDFCKMLMPQHLLYHDDLISYTWGLR